METKRLNMKTESILLLHKRNKSQPQRQTSSQSKGVGDIFQSNEPKKQAGEAILISNKIDCKLKSVKRDKEGHFVLVTGKIEQEEISVLKILNIYAPNKSTPSCVKETLQSLNHTLNHTH